MALKIEELQVLIAANTNQFKGEIAKVTQSLNNLNQTAMHSNQSMQGGLFGTFLGANLVSNVVGNAMRGIQNVFESATESIIQNGSAFSRVKIATDTVTQNLGIARQKVDELRNSLAEANVYGVEGENVIKTLALSGLFDMAQALRTVDARTGEASTGIQALVLTMKDLSAAAGIASDEGIDRITKFIRQGRLEAADGIIEIGRLQLAYKAYADSVNKDVTRLTAAEFAQVRLNIVMQEGQKTFGAYANTMLTSGKIFESIGMRLKAMATTIGSALEPIFTVVGNAMFQFLGGLLGALNEGAGGIRDWATTVAGYIMGFVRLIGRMLSWVPILGAGFQRLANFTLQPVRSVGNLTNSISGASGAMNDLAGNTAKAKKELMGLAAFDEMNLLNPPDKTGANGSDTGGGMGLGGAGGAIDSGIDFGKINDIADQVVADWTNTSHEIQKLFDPTVLLARLPEFAADLADAFGKALHMLDDGLKQVFGVSLGEIIASQIIGPIALLPNLLDHVGLFDFFKQGKLDVLADVRAMSNGAQFEIITMAQNMTTHLVLWESTATAISKKTADDMIKDVQLMRDKVVAASRDKNGKVIADLNYLKDVSKSLTDEQYAQLVEKTTKSGDEQVKAVQDTSAQIEAELRKLSDNGVVITDEMRQNITAKINNLRDEGVAIMSDNQVQQTALLEKLKQTSGQITADQVAFSISKSIEARDAQISDANKTYDDTIARIVRLRDESKTITADQADQMIKNATRSRDEQVKIAEDNHKKIVDSITKMSGDTINQVDVMTGKTKSKFEILWSNLSSGLQTFTSSFQYLWNGFWGTTIPNILNGLKNTISNIWEAIKQRFTDVWNGLRATVEDVWNGIQQSIKNGINGVITWIRGFIDKINGLISSVSGAVSSLGGNPINFRVAQIPYLAEGGVTNRQTLAAIGEGGYQEAVVPLDRNTGWAEKVANLINKAGTDNPGRMHFTLNVGAKTLYDDVIDYINDKALQRNDAVLNI